jgi:hypothetical protein
MQLYNNSNKEDNFQRTYHSLTQEINKFNKFYTIFQQLIFYLNYYEKRLIANFKNKINSFL